MTLVLLIFAVAICVWGALFAQRGSLWLGCTGFVALGYILGPPLWSPRIGPVTLTAERALLLFLGAVYVWNWRQGKLAFRGWTEFDWLLVAAIGYFTLRCAMTPPAPAGGSTAGPWWRLIAAFWTPAILYLIARTTPLDARQWRLVMAALATMGVFLALTALAEVRHQWWAVFPRYIADPTLGTHFGRARGPVLNSASLGVTLSIAFWAAWMLWPQVAVRWRLVLVGVMAATAGAVYFTYTRSTWLGLIAAGAVVPLMQLPKQWRVALALAFALAGSIGVVALADKVANLARKDTDGSAEHSVYQRESFLYVSTRMFRDAPIIGCGFGRFYDLKMPYLADRGQEVELESLRTLDHHNTFLSILVETGLVGFLLFTGLLAGWAKAAWTLARDVRLPRWQRSHGLFLLATLIIYATSALFHDLTLLPTEHWVMFLSAGAASGLVLQQRLAIATEITSTVPAPSALSSAVESLQPTAGSFAT